MLFVIAPELITMHLKQHLIDLKGMPLAPSGIQVIVSSSPEDACVNEPTDNDHVTKRPYISRCIQAQDL